MPRGGHAVRAHARLLGRRSLPSGEGILLRPAASIHTVFMRFSIDAVFLDDDLRVVAISHDLRPWRAARSKRGATRCSSFPPANAPGAASPWAISSASPEPSSPAPRCLDARG